MTGVPRGEKALGYVSLSLSFSLFLSLAHQNSILSGEHLQRSQHGVHGELHRYSGELQVFLSCLYLPSRQLETVQGGDRKWSVASAVTVDASIKLCDWVFLPVLQMAAYFGHSVAASDLNSDG